MSSARRIALEWQGAPDLFVEADPKRLTQVLFNLLSNALKFTRAGGRVDVDLAFHEGQAVVNVRDDGTGIAAGDIPRLFRPFSQVVGSDAPRGSGLGLYISKGIIELHGGRIWCESQGPGKGATFSFRLPRVDATGPGVPDPAPEPAVQAAQG